jgi:hypothetical protein
MTVMDGILAGCAIAILAGGLWMLLSGVGSMGRDSDSSRS